MQSDIRSFKDLDAWKVTMELAVLSYELAKRLPLTELFELSAQIRREAVSVPSNVAEGQAIGRSRRFLYHVRLALGSLGELETNFEIARRLGMFSPEDLAQLHEQINRSGQLLHGLVRSLRSQLVKHTARCLAFLGLLPIGYCRSRPFPCTVPDLR
jgi:four helix bundle protein